MLPFKNLCWFHNRLQIFMRHQSLIGIGTVNYLHPVHSSPQKQIRFASSQAKQTIPINKPTEDWITVYRFNHILFARAIQKFKVYQTAFSCFLIAPTSMGLYLQNYLDEETTTFILGGTLFTCGVLYFVGNIFSRIVGILYTSPSKPEQMKIARLTFWGNRLDTIHAVNDFAPLGDLDYKPADFYFRLKQYSDYNEHMYLSCKHGTIYNLSEFERVFGEVPDDVKVNVVDVVKDKESHTK